MHSKTWKYSQLDKQQESSVQDDNQQTQQNLALNIINQLRDFQYSYQNRNRNLNFQKSRISFDVNQNNKLYLHTRFKKMNFLKNLGRSSIKSRNSFYQLKIKHCIVSSIPKDQFKKKLEQKQYYQIIGFTSQISLTQLTDNDIKRQYFSMIKKYHSDNILDPLQKLDYEQISKCIILAYEKITSERIQHKINKGIYEDIYKDQDQTSMKIFGKKFNEIKYDLYREENADQRVKFMEELENIRKDSKYYQYIRKKQQDHQNKFKMYRESFYKHTAETVQPNYYSKIQKFVAKILFPMFTVIGVFYIAFCFWRKKDKKDYQQQRIKEKHTLGHDKIKQIQKKSIEIYQKKLNDLINSFVQQMPPSLKYPSKDDPDQMDQLIEYTIGPDINLYEVSSNLLVNQSNLQKLKKIKTLEAAKFQFGSEFNPFALTKMKANSAITLSLEAERCLQNIYIKVKDVAAEIQQTGKYTPPKIFFRFYGYLMFELRQKPISLANYRGTEYVSLFDLFFDYYSPIPLKRHQYNEYVVGIQDEDLKMYGQVHLNHRKIPERYITKEDKIVVMREKVGFEEHKYQTIWHKFYQSYMGIWNRGYERRI